VKRTQKKISPEDISARSRSSILDKLNSAGGSINNPLLSRFEDKGGSVFPEPDDLLKTFIAELEEINGKAIIAKDVGAAQTELMSVLKGKGIDEIFCRDEKLLQELNTLPLTNDPGKFTRMKVDTTDEEVESAVKRLAERNRAFSEVKRKRKSRIGEVLVIDFNGAVDGKTTRSRGSQEAVRCG